MFNLGEKLLKVEVIVRSNNQKLGENLKLDTLKFEFPSVGGMKEKKIYYHLFNNWKQIVPENDTALLVNDWNIEHYQFSHYQKTIPLLLGNYGKETENSEEWESEFMRAEEMTKKAEESGCIPRVGYLRMDVDNLGRIFADGLDKEHKNLPRIAGLSRQLSYFFKVYLSSLAEFRQDNFLAQNQCMKEAKFLTTSSRNNLMFIYAGGDDLFISGAWNEVVEFAFDIHQCFRAYTGNNKHITISGGISIDDVKFPLYQSAKSAEKAEDMAKDNGKNSLCLFYQVFKWDEWLGFKDIQILNSDIQGYLNPEDKPNLLGILPFVERLHNQNIGVDYSRRFVRNLLIAAETQEKALEKFTEKKQSQEALGTRYYLHLPKVAYTLARLPKKVLDDKDFRASLKNPYNAPYFRAIATWIELLNRK